MKLNIPTGHARLGRIHRSSVPERAAGLVSARVVSSVPVPPCRRDQRSEQRTGGVRHDVDQRGIARRHEESHGLNGETEHGAEPADDTHAGPRGQLDVLAGPIEQLGS